jgi:hypothetical protein
MNAKLSDPDGYQAKSRTLKDNASFSRTIITTMVYWALVTTGYTKIAMEKFGWAETTGLQFTIRQLSQIQIHFLPTYK